MKLVVDAVTLVRGSAQFQYTLTAPAGVCLAIMGPSGAGKSSLLHLIAGFETPRSGSIFFDDSPLHILPPGERPVSILFQKHNLFEHLTLWNNVALGLRGALDLSAAEKKQVQNALDIVGLSDLGQKYPKETSGGEEQRAAIARCILQKRPLLLLDEPFHSLDPENRLDMLKLIKQLHHDMGLTTLMVTHHPEEAYFMEAIGVFINQNRILASGPLDDILKNKTPAVEAFQQSYTQLHQDLGH